MMRVRRGLRARPGRACLRVNDDATDERARRGQRRESEKCRRREASGIADETRALNLLAVQLRQPVNELALQLNRRVLAPVVLSELRRIAQTKVAGEVNDLHARRQTRHDLQSLPVREREKDAIQLARVL